MDKVIWGVPSFWIERFPMYWARDRGLFQDRGIELELKYFYGGPELCQAVESGEIQVGDIGLPPFLKAWSQGLPARIVAGTMMQKLDHYLAVRPGIENFADLRGRSIGILSFGSCDEYFIRRLLIAEGVDPKETTLVCQGGGLGRDPARFFAQGLDAGFVVEPRLSQGELGGRLKILARVGDYFPRYQWGVMFARDDFLETGAGWLGRVLEAYRLACREIQSDPESSVPLGAEVFGVSPEVFGRALRRNLANWDLEAGLDLEGLENAIGVQKELGALPRDFSSAGLVRAL